MRLKKFGQKTFFKVVFENTSETYPGFRNPSWSRNPTKKKSFQSFSNTLPGFRNRSLWNWFPTIQKKKVRKTFFLKLSNSFFRKLTQGSGIQVRSRVPINKKKVTVSKPSLIKKIFKSFKVTKLTNISSIHQSEAGIYKIKKEMVQ